MEPLNITITDLSLETVVGSDHHDAPLTLLDAIVNAAVHHLAKGDEYRGVTTDLRARVVSIRDEEIRQRVVLEVEAALSEPFRAANTYGEASGQPQTMRTVIAAKANDFFTKNIADYNRPRRTLADDFVTKAVHEALAKELATAIADEKAKVVAAVRAKAAELIATAVKEGVGR